MAAISGTVLDKDGNGVARLVRVYLQSDGSLVGSVKSTAGTGAFSITTAVAAPHYVVCSDAIIFPYVPSLLLHGNGANGGTTFTDNAPTPHTVVRNNAIITTSTAQSKFNGSAIAFTGGLDHLRMATLGTEFTFGTGDFTIEMWVYRNATGVYEVLLDWRPLSVDGLYPAVQIENTGKVFFNLNTGLSLATVNTVGLGSTTGWHHIAVTRQGTTARIFLDGQLENSTTNSSNFLGGSSNRPCLGCLGYNVNSWRFNGYLAEVLVVKGAALYTNTFELPTIPAASDIQGANAMVYDNVYPV